MFGLGVFVGRGTSPVLFETRPFQERLGRMVWQFSAKVPEKKKVDLKFYDVLDDPEYHRAKGQTDDLGEITPAPEAGKSLSIQSTSDKKLPVEKIPVKRSKKQVSWHKAVQDNDAGSTTAAPQRVPVKTEPKVVKKKSVGKLVQKRLKSKPQPVKKTETASEKTRSVTKKTTIATNGSYTIQVASYKNLKDALAQIIFLDKKGISSYKVSVKINGDTWYRVRTGSFADSRAAGYELTKLGDSGVNGMIIKKE